MQESPPSTISQSHNLLTQRRIRLSLVFGESFRSPNKQSVRNRVLPPANSAAKLHWTYHLVLVNCCTSDCPSQAPFSTLLQLGDCLATIEGICNVQSHVSLISN